MRPKPTIHALTAYGLHPRLRQLPDDAQAQRPSFAQGKLRSQIGRLQTELRAIEADPRLTPEGKSEKVRELARRYRGDLAGETGLGRVRALAMRHMGQAQNFRAEILKEMRAATSELTLYESVRAAQDSEALARLDSKEQRRMLEDAIENGDRRVLRACSDAPIGSPLTLGVPGSTIADTARRELERLIVGEAQLTAVRVNEYEAEAIAQNFRDLDAALGELERNPESWRAPADDAAGLKEAHRRKAEAATAPYVAEPPGPDMPTGSSANSAGVPSLSRLQQAHAAK